jgi:ribonuclease BN (tRNA processing enzyme)
MFTSDELSMRKGWGHSSIEQGNDFLDNTGAQKLGICHHSPYRDDKAMMALEREIANKNLFLAREGQVITI